MKAAPWRGRGGGIFKVFASLDYTGRPTAPQDLLDAIASPVLTDGIALAERRLHRAEAIRDQLRAEQRRAALRAARHAFAEINGWKIAGRMFTVEALARGMMHGGKFEGFPYGAMDHAEFFRDGRWPVAIVAHPYPPPGNPDERDVIARHGLIVHRPVALKASWYAPGMTYCVCWTRPGVAVRWLPEQSDPRWGVQR